MKAFIAVLALVATPATAAPVVYGMTFFDDQGAEVGAGSLTRFDPERLFIDGEDGGLCWINSAFCIDAGLVRPVTIEGTIFGAIILPHFDLYAGFSHVYDPRSPFRGTFDFNNWGVIANGPHEFFLDIGIGDLFADAFLTTFDFSSGTATGTVAFQRIAETPLPAAAWLFLAGLLGMTMRRHGVSSPPSSDIETPHGN